MSDLDPVDPDLEVKGLPNIDKSNNPSNNATNSTAPQIIVNNATSITPTLEQSSPDAAARRAVSRTSHRSQGSAASASYTSATETVQSPSPAYGQNSSASPDSPNRNANLTTSVGTPGTSAAYSVQLQRRTLELYGLFRGQIPENEQVVDDYGCALQRDILVQGRLYLTERFLCFYANIFGWVTTVVVPMSDIIAVEKRSTLFIPNAMLVSTLHSKYYFTSFLSRDVAYQKLILLWRKLQRDNNNSTLSSGQQVLSENESVFSDDELPATIKQSLLLRRNEAIARLQLDADARRALARSRRCECTTHYKYTLMDASFAVSMKSIVLMLFGEGSKFFADVLTSLECSDLKTTPWAKGLGSIETRDVSFIARHRDPFFGLFETPCIIRDQYVERRRHGISVRSVICWPQVPIRPLAFCQQYCITATSPSSVHILVTAEPFLGSRHVLIRAPVTTFICQFQQRYFDRVARSLTDSMAPELANSCKEVKKSGVSALSFAFRDPVVTPLFLIVVLLSMSLIVQIEYLL